MVASAPGFPVEPVGAMAAFGGGRPGPSAVIARAPRQRSSSVSDLVAKARFVSMSWEMRRASQECPKTGGYRTRQSVQILGLGSTPAETREHHAVSASPIGRFSAPRNL